jgi:hypothetical protein
LPRFVILQPPRSSDSPIDFEDFVGITKGLSISSAAASTSDSRGPDFLELGLSRTFNLRVQASGDALVVSLVATLNPGEFAPVRVEIIGRNEMVTAELLQRRLHSLRQVYATALLLGDDRENDLVGVLRDDPHADLERELVAEEDKLVIQEAGPGSLILSLVATTRKAYQAILYTCAVPFAEGRKALLGRVAAGTALAELEVKAKTQDMRLKGALGVLDLAKKIDTIKDKDTRELIRQRFLADMGGLAPAEALTSQPPTLESLTDFVGLSLEKALTSQPPALESVHTLRTSFEPPKTSVRADPITKPTKGKSGRSKRGERR